jgi:serine/threonine-protein kinase
VLVGSDGVVKVVDFGVAKARGRVQQTAQGQIKGKLAYMSPEQARGKPVDARSDVFAAGIVLWELLAGKRLFEGDNEAHVLTQLLTERPARLADVDPSLAPYDALVARALSVEPADRYASALAMAEAIEATLPVATREELARWVSEEAGEVLRRRRDVIARHTSDAEAATKVDASSAPVAPPATTPIAVTGGSPPAPGQLPPSALMTQRLDPADRPSIDAALPHYLQRGGPSGRPSDAPPAQSQVTKVALTTNDLPPPLPEERVRQLVGIGVGTAVTVAAMLASVLVVAKHSPPPPSSAVRAGLALAAHVVPRVTRASSESASPSTAASAPSASSSTAASATASAIAPTPKPPVPQAPRPAPKPGTAKPAGPTRSTSPAPPKKTR